MRRFDNAEMVGVPIETPEGYLKATVCVTTSGVFKYRNKDGSSRYEYRPREEVTREDSLKTATMLPVTNTHPKEFVNKTNVRKYSVGSTGENYTTNEDGDVFLPVVIMDADAVDAVKNRNRRQFSLAYDLQLEKNPGTTPDGKRYDAVQRDIEYNHLALVDVGRAGPKAAFRFDAADAEDAERIDDEGGQTNTFKGACKMQIVINGVAHDVNDEVGKAYADANRRADSATAELDKKSAALDAATEKLTAAEKTKNTDSAADTDKVKARVRVVLVAQKAMDSAGVEGVVSAANDTDAMKAVLLAKNPGLMLTGKSDGYVQARFDMLEEELSKEPEPKKEEQKSPQQTQFKRNADSASGEVDTRDMAAAYKRQFQA